MEQNPNNNWVAERLSALQPEWNRAIHSGAAKTRLHARLTEEKRAWLSPATRIATAGTVALLVVIAAALPQGRALAQEIWYRMFVRSFDVVRLDLSRLPLSTSVTTNGMQQVAGNVDDAARLAGYRPVLRSEAVSEMAVTGPIQIRQVVRVREVNAALLRAGVRDVTAPQEWEGVTISTEISPMVIAEYRDGVQVTQALPMPLQFPASFPLAQFAEVAFRCTGIPAWQARAMGERFARNPSWLFDIPEDEVVHIEEVVLSGAINGLLIEDPNENGNSRVAILFGTPDRIFAVSSSSRELTIQAARSLVK